LRAATATRPAPRNSTLRQTEGAKITYKIGDGEEKVYDKPFGISASAKISVTASKEDMKSAETQKDCEFMVFDGLAVAKGINSISIIDNEKNYQAAISFFALTNKYQAKTGECISLNIVGTSDVDIKGLKFTFVDTTEAANWWTPISGYPEIGDIKGGVPFDVTVPVIFSADASSFAADACKFVVMYDKDESNTEPAVLTLTKFAVSGVESKPAFNISTAETMYTQSNTNNITSSEYSGLDFTNDDMYLVVYINASTDSSKVGWGFGAITNSDKTKNIISFNAPKEDDVKFWSLKDLGDSLKEAGEDSPSQITFNIWGDYSTVSKVSIMK